MTRADLVICAGLNEGTWPPVPARRSAARPRRAARAGGAGGGFPHWPCRARSGRSTGCARSGAEPGAARNVRPRHRFALPAAGARAARRRSGGAARGSRPARTGPRAGRRARSQHRPASAAAPGAERRAAPRTRSASPRSTGCGAILTNSTRARSSACPNSNCSMPIPAPRGRARLPTRSWRTGTRGRARWRSWPTIICANCPPTRCCARCGDRACWRGCNGSKASWRISRGAFR